MLCCVANIILLTMFVFRPLPQDYRQREEAEWWKVWREGRALAAARLQAAVRGQCVRRQLWAEVRKALRRRSDIRLGRM